MKRGDYRKELYHFNYSLLEHFIQFAFFHDLDSTQAYSACEMMKQILDDAYEKYCGRYLK